MSHRTLDTKNHTFGKIFSVVHLIAVVSVAAVAVWWFFTRPDAWTPFASFPSPQRILAKKPFYHPGDTIRILAQKCYGDQEPFVFTGVSYWIRENPYRSIIREGDEFGITNPKEFEGGCVMHMYEDQLPLDMKPGTWKLEGQETARRDSDTITVSWYTDTFLVKGGNK